MIPAEDGWPSRGQLAVQDLWMRYRPDLPYSLKVRANPKKGASVHLPPLWRAAGEGWGVRMLAKPNHFTNHFCGSSLCQQLRGRTRHLGEPLRGARMRVTERGTRCRGRAGLELRGGSRREGGRGGAHRRRQVESDAGTAADGGAGEGPCHA
eukprot:1184620-Prorocentrum_minimum.AAC.1